MKKHCSLTVRKTTVTNRGKTFAVIEPLKPLDYLFVVSGSVDQPGLFGYPSALRKLSLLVSLSARHPEAVLHVPIRPCKPTYLAHLPDSSLHLALCHHTLQLRHSDWKDIRNRLGNWQKSTLRYTDPSIEVEREFEPWYKRDADILDIKEAANTLFAIGSQPVLSLFAHNLKNISTAGNADDWHFHMWGHCRQRKAAQGDDDLIVTTVSRQYRP